MGSPFRDLAAPGARLCVLLLVAPWTAASLAAQPAAGQAGEIRGRVFGEDSTTGIGAIVVTASDESGHVVARALTRDRGQYILQLARPARYTLRALRIGFRPTPASPVQLAAGQTRVVDIVLGGAAVSLAPVRVRSETECRMSSDSSALVVQLWEQARTALSAATLGDAGQPLVATARIYERTLDASGSKVRAETSSVVQGATLRPFVSLPPDSLARIGYVTETPSGTEYRAPDADVLLSDSFAALHCFSAQQAPADHAEWIGVGVRPAEARRGVNEIEGTLWLDRASSELRLFEYLYTELPGEVTRAKAGGRVEFLRLATGLWIVNRWAIRMPEVAIQRNAQGVDPYRRIENRPIVQAIRIKGGEITDIFRGGISLYHLPPPVVASGRPLAPDPSAAKAASTVLIPATAPADTSSVRHRLTGGAVLTGRIIQSGDTVGVPGAEIEITGTGHVHWADNHGRFRFVGIRGGSYDVRVRMLGYQPRITPMQFEDGRAYDHDVELKRLPYALTEVRIAGRAMKVPARYEEVYRRGARGLGTLIDREEIERSNAMDVKSLLQRIPGVLVNDRGITFQRCQSGLDGMSAIGSQGSVRAVWPAKVQVYIDGVRMTRPFDPEADAEHALLIVPTTAIQVIEVYRGVAEIPAEFLDDACAVIAIWTKAY